MDLLTQGLVGSAVAQSFAEPKAQGRAAWCGAVAGMAPDLDALIRSSADPLLNLDYHRHFSHSLAFIPVGATLVALLIWWLSRRRFDFREIWQACMLGYGTHGLLDACTSYGTHLFWPFGLERVSGNLVSIVDPLFSLPLLVLLILGMKRRQLWYPRAASICCLSYLLFAFTQHRQAESAQAALIDRRDHTAARQIVKPSIGNVFLHRSVYLHDGVYYVDAIHVCPGLTPKIYPGGEIEVYEIPNADLAPSANPRMAKDVARFARLSDGFLGQHPEAADVIGDVRYGMLPTSTVPLWGIKINPAQPETAAEFVKFRIIGPGDKEAFYGMLFRRDLPGGKE
jgi:inner membrane protein